MNMIQKTAGGIVLLPLDSKLYSERKIFLEGEINNESAVEFVKQLLILSKEDKDSTIDIFINSPGGEITSGMLIYDAITTCETPLRMFCIGSAYSMAALIFASGRKGYRYIFEHSHAMIHEPLLGNRVGGNCSSLKNISETLMDTRRMLNEILSKHTGRTISEVEEATSYDHFFNANEAIAWGIADKIADFSTLIEG
mgnify:CR=1 FL=1